MSFESWDDFIEEWQQPNSLNYLVSYSWFPDEQNPVFGSWYLSIFQPRKERVHNVEIGPVMHIQTFNKVKEWARKSVEVLASSLTDDEQSSHEEYVNNLPVGASK